MYCLELKEFASFRLKIILTAWKLQATAIDSSYTHAESLLEIEVNPYGITPVKDDANPSLVDIDDDGDLDLFIGDLKGHTYYFENKGSREKASFTYQNKNAFGIVDVGGFASPEFIDIDGDGDQDLFTGNRKGKTKYIENLGSAITPDFSSSVVLDPLD